MRADVNDYARARVGKAITSKYRLERLIGCGGMAAVYEAVHRNGHRVAIKMLHPHLSIESDLRTRFLREGYVANKVDHRGAVRVADDDVTDDGSVFLVMELLEGETLDTRWEHQGRRLPLPEVCGLAGQLLDVLEVAHARGVVHRDIKPENLFLTSEGVLKVLDFGIARLREANGPEGATRTGRMIGTPAFMPPEQALGRSRLIDGQTDLWAVGATMFTLASGQFVHQAETMEEMLVQAGSRPARSILSVLPAIAADVALVIDRALAFNKEERWPDARAMHLALVQAHAAAYGASLPGPRSRTREEVDPYGATAARSTAAAGSPALEPLPAAPPGVSTTAGTAHPAEGVGELALGIPRGRARAPKLLALGAAATLLAAGTALVAVRTSSLARQGATPGAIPATNAPAEPAVAPASALAAGQAVTFAPAPVPVATDPSARAGAGHDPSSFPLAAGRPASAAPGHARAPQNPQGSTAAAPAGAPGVALRLETSGAASPAGPGPIGVVVTAAPSAVDLGLTAPLAGTPVATTIAAPPTVPVETPSPAAPAKPTCRAVPYFDSDGQKHFKQECR